MENLKLSKGLVELKASELELISGGLVYEVGKRLHLAYCNLRDWANNYEGDPFIRRKMGGL